MRKKDMADKKFLAALQGVDLDENLPSQEGEDITSIKGLRAKQDGFGIGLGLGHVVEEHL